jgi:cell division protein ZapA
MTDEVRDVGVTQVTIFGQTYHLRGAEDATYMTELAALVDRKMHDVEEATGTADSYKVAVLAALNIADDYLQARRGQAAPLEGGSNERLARMIRLLGEALAA